jgi:CspA family cold shock protein
VPTGKIKWFEEDKGFGRIESDDGQDVFLHASALPDGVTSIRRGTRVEYGVADGRKGPQALSVRVIDPLPSVARAHRKSPEEMVVIVEDLIKLLDGVSNSLRRGRYPDKKAAEKVAQVLRAVASDVEP